FIGNIICFCANSFAMLLTGRIVSALGGGILTPLGQSIAMSIFPPEKRGTIMGMVGIAIGVAPAIGPTLSGWIIDNANWRMFIGNIICFCANSFAMLLTGRIVSALGGGILTPLGQSIAMSIFPPEKRGTIMGMVGIAIGVAPAIGPTLSGWIIDNANWRMIFGVTLPFIGLDLLLSFFFMKKVLPTKKLKLDVLSAIMAVIGFGSLLYGTSEAGNDGWGSMVVIVSIIIGVIFIALFSWRQFKLETPFLDLRLLKNWHFSLASLLGSIARIALVGVELVLPLYIQIVRGESAFHSGLMLLPGALLMGLMSPISGILFDKLGARTLAITGLTLLTL